MINKFKVFEIECAQHILGGEVSEMQRETNLNRAKSASKLHNKMVQVIMS